MKAIRCDCENRLAECRPHLLHFWRFLSHSATVKCDNSRNWSLNKKGDTIRRKPAGFLIAKGDDNAKKTMYHIKHPRLCAQVSWSVLLYSPSIFLRTLKFSTCRRHIFYNQIISHEVYIFLLPFLFQFRQLPFPYAHTYIPFNVSTNFINLLMALQRRAWFAMHNVFFDLY